MFRGSKTGMWFETLFIIFINVFKVDIIYIIFNFWDIIHYFCQVQTLFKWIRHYLSKLIWICAETASFSPEITLSILGSSRTQPGLQSAPSRIQMGQICPFVANQDMLRLCAFLDIIYEKYTLFFKFKTLLLYWETLFVQLPNHRAEVFHKIPVLFWRWLPIFLAQSIIKKNSDEWISPVIWKLDK